MLYNLEVRGDKTKYIDPQVQLAYTGDSASIKCTSDTPPKWRKNGKNLDYMISEPYNGYNEVITITTLAAGDSGIYECIGSIGNEEIKHRSLLFVGGLF